MNHDFRVLKQVKQKRLDDATQILTHSRLELQRKERALEQAQAAWRQSVQVEAQNKQVLIETAVQGVSRRDLDQLRWDFDKSRAQALEKKQVVSQSEQVKQVAAQAVVEARYEYQKKSAALEKIKTVHEQQMLNIKRQRDAQEESKMEENFLGRLNLIAA